MATEEDANLVYNKNELIKFHVLSGDIEVSKFRFRKWNNLKLLEGSIVIDFLKLDGLSGKFCFKSSDGKLDDILDESRIFIYSDVYIQLDLKSQERQKLMSARKKKFLKSKESIKVAKLVWKKTLLEYDQFDRNETHYFGELIISSMILIT